jgi:hypothetical protein
MVSSGMLHRVDLVRAGVSEEPSASFSRVTRIGELGTTLAVTSNRRTLRRNNFFASADISELVNIHFFLETLLKAVMNFWVA